MNPHKPQAADFFADCNKTPDLFSLQIAMHVVRGNKMSVRCRRDAATRPESARLLQGFRQRDTRLTDNELAGTGPAPSPLSLAAGTIIVFPALPLAATCVNHRATQRKATCLTLHACVTYAARVTHASRARLDHRANEPSPSTGSHAAILQRQR